MPTSTTMCLFRRIWWWTKGLHTGLSILSAIWLPTPVGITVGGMFRISSRLSVVCCCPMSSPCTVSWSWTAWRTAMPGRRFSKHTSPWGRCSNRPWWMTWLPSIPWTVCDIPFLTVEEQRRFGGSEKTPQLLPMCIDFGNRFAHGWTDRTNLGRCWLGKADTDRQQNPRVSASPRLLAGRSAQNHAELLHDPSNRACLRDSQNGGIQPVQSQRIGTAWAGLILHKIGVPVKKPAL